jgi:hypothetical protein
MKKFLKNKKRYWILTATIAIIVIVFGGYIFGYGLSSEERTYVKADPVYITTENLPGYLNRFTMVDDLPSGTSINLIIGDTNYKVDGDGVVIGKFEDPDITLTLPGEYLDREWTGICSTVKEALGEGDLGIETHLSKTRLAWKYKKMLEYKDCISS